MEFMPCLARSTADGEIEKIRLGHPLLDDYLVFVAARARASTWLAVAYDLKVFFEVVGKEPAVVTTADAAGVQANRRPVSGRGLGDLVQPQRLPPFGEQPVPDLSGSEDLAGQGATGRGDGPRDHGDARVRGLDGRQLGGGPLLPAGAVCLRDPAAGHQVTSRPVSQPACSSAARASSAVR